MTHLFCSFPWSRILIPCLYFNKNFSISFFILLSAKDSLLFTINSISWFKFSSTSFDQSKLKRSFGISYHNNIFFHGYNDLIRLLYTFLVIILCWYKRYNICFISVFSLYELFPVFICGNSIGSLVNNLFRIKTFNHFPSFNSFHHLLMVALAVYQSILLYQTILLTTHYNHIL